MSVHQPLQTAPPKPASLPARVWRQPSGKVGIVLTGFMVLVAILGYLFAEAITGYSPTEFIGQPFESIGLFGTDGQGRSVASRVLAGGLALLWYATAATAIGVVVGTLLGAIAGYAGGVVDFVMMRINDALQALPQLVLALLAILIFGSSGLVLTLVIGLAQASRVVRVARSATQSVTSQDYVLAAQMYGMPRRPILSREILANITGPRPVGSGLRFTYAIEIGRAHV